MLNTFLWLVIAGVLTFCLNVLANWFLKPPNLSLCGSVGSRSS